MSKELVIWITIAVYAVFILAVGVFAGRKSKTITDFTVGGRNAGAWMSAFSYGTAYFSAGTMACGPYCPVSETP